MLLHLLSIAFIFVARLTITDAGTPCPLVLRHPHQRALVGQCVEAQIRTVWQDTASRFPVPARWSPHEWRDALVIGCGLSALSARATLAGAKRSRNVYRDPDRIRPQLRNGGSRLIGVSLSGTSAEVVAALRLAREAGRPHVMLTAAPDTDDAISLPDLDCPRALRHLAICAALARLMGVATTVGAVRICASLAPVLDECMSRGLTPIIVAPRGSFDAVVLTAYWREFLHRPATRLVYPDWTHDYLWAFARAPIAQSCFVAMPPRHDLPDDRFTRVVAWLRRAGHHVHVLDAPPRPMQHVQRLADLAATFYAAAVRAGCDLETELGLNDAALVQ